MNKKETIIQSALKLFSAKGFEGTSVREIASDAGVNVAMINYYFTSKENLFKSVVEYRAMFLTGFLSDLIHNKNLSAIEKVDAVIDQTIEKKLSNTEFNHILHRELSLDHRPQLRDAISDIILKNIIPVKAIIKEGIKSGEFKKRRYRIDHYHGYWYDSLFVEFRHHLPQNTRQKRRLYPYSKETFKKTIKCAP